MSSRDQGATSTSRPRKQDNARSPHAPPNSLTSKKSVAEYFSVSSRFLTTANPYHKVKASGNPYSRPSNADTVTTPRHALQKQTDNTARDSTNNRFLWAKGELIGQGSHGRVYLGFNATTGELMAVKQVEVPLTPDDRRKAEIMDYVQTLRSERETLRHLAHPNIVEYLGFEENPETVNIFLQYVSGGTISRCLEEYGPFNEEVTKSFAHQILEGIAYLHSNGIIHRDLKSDNILIDPAGVCKISDFGISKKLEFDRAFSGFKGTSYWMAPEVVLADKSEGYSFKVDIWSVGCIVFEMWTAKRPWHEESNFLRVLQKLSNKEAPSLPSGFQLSGLGGHFRQECFHADPAQRPAAELLLTHPYLELPPGWSFPGISDMGDGSRNNSSPTSLTTTGGLFTSGSHVMAYTGVNNPVPVSPKLAFVTPPPPRKPLPIPNSPSQSRPRSRSAASDSSGSQTASQLSTGSTTQRKLEMHDPRTVPDVTKRKKRDLPKPPVQRPFIYKPPELPPIDATTPYSNSLAPSTKYVVPSSGRKSSAKMFTLHRGPDIASTLSLPTSMSHRMGPANLKDVMAEVSTINSSAYHSDNDTHTQSTESYSGWARPPLHSGASPRRRPTLPLLPSQRIKPITPSSARRQSIVFSGVTRPDSRQVLEHMKVYFPDHDLDEPLVSSPIKADIPPVQEADLDVIPLARQFTMRSMQSIAEEQIQLNPNRRRQTRLWDSSIEEIKAHKV